MTLTMPGTSLDSFINGPVIQNDPELEVLLKDLDSRTDTIFYVPNLQEGRLEYINSTCNSILGYPAHDFLKGGPDFIFSITHPQAIPEILERQVTYTRGPKVPGFNPKTVLVHEFPTTMIRKDQETVDLLCLAAPLTYTPQADMQILLCLLLEPTDRKIDDGKSMLEKLKNRHNTIYQHPALTSHREPLQRLYTTARRDDKLITMREMDVLSLLSKGFSTKEIAEMLSISSHTAESHRKSLLEKFHAKNAAELVKKASKVFWLE